MNNGNAEFRTVYEEYRPKILRYLQRLAGERDAEDMAQEAFLRVHKSLSEFRGESSLSTWIYKIATNVFLDRKRQSAARDGI